MVTLKGRNLMDHLETLLGDSMAGYPEMRPYERTWLGILYHIDETGKFPDPEDRVGHREAWSLYTKGYIEEGRLARSNT